MQEVDFAPSLEAGHACSWPLLAMGEGTRLGPRGLGGCIE